MVDIKDMSYTQLEKYIVDLGGQKYRAHQIFSWIYKGVTSFDEMKNIPKELREELKKNAEISFLEKSVVQKSKDGTQKFLFKLRDGNTIESVFMKYKYGNSICVSSQAGCKMGCSFCASAIGGLKRNLTASEMIDEILCVEAETGEKINHIVVMGTGEPFDNEENLYKFIELVHEKEGMNISLRNITVSTCGLVKGIENFGKKYPQVNLAISLHSTIDEKRKEMMPITNKHSVKELIDACRNHARVTGRRVTFEYALVKDKNDGREDIDDLISKIRGINCHVNLIPLNEVKETGMMGSNKKRALEIAKYLEEKRITATVRREMGSDIAAACGQLRLGKETTDS